LCYYNLSSSLTSWKSELKEQSCSRGGHRG
jgi:hypothetical protein